MRRLLEGLAPFAAPGVEWTVEANPESLDEDFLAIARGAGVTRISLGVQALDETCLRELGRPAGLDATRAGLARAAAAGKTAGKGGFELSADLIAALPWRSPPAALAAEAAELLDAGFGHLSVYELELEEGTALEARARRGDFDPPAEETLAAEAAALKDLFDARGLARYEVSNYALPGRESRHNQAYWSMRSYIGAGPGAVSTLAGLGADSPSHRRSLRIEESRAREAYLAGEAAAKAREELLGPRDAAFELVMMGLRTRRGLDRGDFARRIGFEPEALAPGCFARWGGRFAEAEAGTRLALDERGIDLLDRFLAELLLELEGRDPFAAEPQEGPAARDTTLEEA